MPVDAAMRRWGRWGLLLYALCTLTAGLHLLWVFSRPGEAMAGWAAEGPFSKWWVTSIALSLVWLLAGSFLVLLERGWVRGKWLLTILLFYAVALLYVAMLRERIEYGDAWDYVKAAFNIYHGQPLFERYVYPPFWATFLRLFAALGPKGVVGVCVVMSLLSLLGFYWLLAALLRRYGFSHNLAAVVVAAALLVNVAVQRTLFYAQVNLLVMDLVLILMLALRRWPVIGGSALALAVHIKMSPAVFVLPLLLGRQVKCLVACAVAGLAVVGLTMLAGANWDYHLNALHNIRNIHTCLPPNEFYRNVSIDNLFLTGAGLGGMDAKLALRLALAVKLAALAGLLMLTVRVVRRRPFLDQAGGEALLFNMTPPLLLIMVIASPYFWDHHPVFLLPAFLPLLPHLRGGRDIFWFAVAWFLLFLLPIFDVYPLAHMRLAALGILAVLLSQARADQAEGTLGAMNRWADRLTAISLPETG